MTMTTDEFRGCLEAMGWSQRQLADYLALAKTTVQRWATGAGEVPVNVAAWLRLRAAHDRRHPYPADWQVRP